MKQYRRYFLHIALYAVLMAGLYFLLAVTAAIPNTAIQKNMLRSAKVYSNADRYEFSEDGSFQSVTDNHADLMWLNIGWQMGSENPFVSCLDMKLYDGEKFGTAAGLYLTVVRGVPANAGYSRYWHGTAGLLRVLHLFTDIRGAKVIGFLCLAALILKTMYDLIRAGHRDLSLCLAASLVLIQFWNLRLSAEYLPCFLICFGLCPAYLRTEKKSDFSLELLSVISGTLTAFFDFLTTETVTILVPLILVIAVRSREHRLGSPRKVFRLLMRCCLCWVLAYGGTFLLKWITVSLVTGTNHFSMALDSAAKRFRGVVTADQLRKKPGMFMAIAANFSAFFHGTSRTAYRQVIIYLLVAAVLIRFFYRQNQTSSKLRPGTLFLLLLGSVVLLRFALLANHSYMHAFFTYRALISPVLALLSAVVLNLRPWKKEGGYPWK